MRILLADDHRILRDGLKALLAEEEGLEVVGEAGTGHEALLMAHRLKPDIVLMDISMPELNGIDATRRLATELPSIKVLALSMNSEQRYVVAMFAAGAVGYLLKDSATSELVQAIRAVASDQMYVSPAIAGTVVDGLVRADGAAAPRSDERLTGREREVLQLIAEGKSSKEIATRLDVPLTTVENHRRQIMDKLNLRSIAELTKYAIREGLTSVGT
jgi:DNA-binding NarL/FixJ family response regulator